MNSRRTSRSAEPLLWDFVFAFFVFWRYASDSQTSNQTTPTLKTISERPQAMVTLPTSGHEIPKRLFPTEWMDGAGIEHAETAPSDSLRWRSVKTTVKTSVKTSVKTPWKLRENFVKTLWKLCEKNMARKHRKYATKHVCENSRPVHISFHRNSTKFPQRFSHQFSRPCLCTYMSRKLLTVRAVTLC